MLLLLTPASVQHAQERTAVLDRCVSSRNLCAVALGFCSLIYMNRLPHCSGLIIILNYFQYGRKTQFAFLC